MDSFEGMESRSKPHRQTFLSCFYATIRFMRTTWPYIHFLQHISLNDDETKELMRQLPVLPAKVYLALISNLKQSYLAQLVTPQRLTICSQVTLGNIDTYLKIRSNPKAIDVQAILCRFKTTVGDTPSSPKVQDMGYPSHPCRYYRRHHRRSLPYLDLKASERVKIDEAYGNQIIQRFDIYR